MGGLRSKPTLVGADADESRHAASRLETSAHAKLLEFEGMTIQTNEKLQRPKSAVILGMDTRIKTFKSRIWKAKGEHEKKYDTPFIELNTLRELEKDPNQQRTRKATAMS